jgi:signal transduction histidine kinase
LTSPAPLDELLAIARADERERIALDLHDGVGPLITGARMQVEALLADRSHDGGEMLAVLRTLLEECGAELRRTVLELCPPQLADGGVVAALEHHVALVGLDCRVTLCGEPCRLPPSRELAVLRFAQEALANASRHAGGRGLEVKVAFGPDGATVTVTDAGPGVARVGGGLGRRSMRRNARRAQGALRIASSPAGTTAQLSVPR